MSKQHVTDFALFGGKPAFASFRTTMNLVVPDREIFYHYIKHSFDIRHLTNNGPSVQELEQQLANYHQVKHCIAVSNGFTAIQLALHILTANQPQKNEVILPTLTYRRMADIVDWAGLTPCFCDVDNLSGGISPEIAQQHIHDKTAAILAPHPRVRLCDIAGMEELAAKYNLPLIYDSVEACGATYRGVPLGRFGNCEVFSMHADKVINACEGGYITTNDEELAYKLRITRAFGFAKRDQIECLGLNAKLNELHAAMGLASFAHIDEQLDRNKKLFNLYHSIIQNIDGIHIIPYDLNEKRNWRSVLVYFDEIWPFTRDETIKFLNAERINARSYYSPLLHLTFKDGIYKGINSFPVAEYIARTHAILPIGTSVFNEDIYKIGELLQDMLRLHEPLRRHLAEII